MKRFTARSSKKKPTVQRKPRSSSNPKPYNAADAVSSSWSSTDPKDLPEGFTVGSMSVPYPPPYLTQQSDPYGTYPRKNKNHWSLRSRKLKKKGKDHVDGGKASGSPLASHAFKVKVSHKETIKVSDEEVVTLRKRMDFAEKAMKLQRSRSLGDGIDDVGKEDDAVPPLTSRRKSSMEHPSLTPPVYSLTERSRRAYRWTDTRSFHGRSRLTDTESPAQLQREFSRTTPQKTLHKPKSVENLVEVLRTGIDVNTLDDITGDAPIHAIVKRKRKDRLEVLLALLVNSNADVNLPNRTERAALHLAVEEGDDMCVRALIVFGANINQQGCNQFTPLDLAIDNGRVPQIEELLFDLEAKSSTQLIAKFHKKVPRLHSFAENMHPPRRGERLSTNDKLSEFINRRGVKKLYHELEMNVNRRLSLSTSIGGSDDAYALVLQQRELALYNKTLRKSKHSNASSFNPEGGSRLLFMDGGGIKGLAEIEVLIQLEERTKRKITDLFDWIIGTSTGGIIALAMVYGKRSLKDLRQLFFLLKSRIFSKARYGFGYNTENLEEILKEYLDPSISMTDVTHPKVLIAAVNKSTTNLELNFFNNCFGDDFTDFPVWKVARYTSAAPMFFSECDDYVDGGVLCNNPTDSGLTAIQNFYRLQGKKFPIALVVSIGSGKYPPEKLGSVDAQDFLFFGKQWLNPSKLMKRTQSLFALLSNAIVESEMVAENSRSRCEEQEIPFYRFSATLNEIIAAGETDNEKLFNMVIQTKMQTKGQGIDDVVEMFHLVAEVSKGVNKSIEEEYESPFVPHKPIQNPQPLFAIGEVADETQSASVKPSYLSPAVEDHDTSSQHSPSDTSESQTSLVYELDIDPLEFNDDIQDLPGAVVKPQEVPEQNEDQTLPTHEKDEDNNAPLVPEQNEDDNAPLVPEQNEDESQITKLEESEDELVPLPEQQDEDQSLPERTEDQVLPDQTVPAQEQDELLPLPEQRENRNTLVLEQGEDQNLTWPEREDQTPPPPEQSEDQNPPPEQRDQNPPLPEQREDQTPPLPEQSEDQNPPSEQTKEKNLLLEQSEDQTPPLSDLEQSEDQTPPLSDLEQSEDQNEPTEEPKGHQVLPLSEQDEDQDLPLVEDCNKPTQEQNEDQVLPSLQENATSLPLSEKDEEPFRVLDMTGSIQADLYKHYKLHTHEPETKSNKEAKKKSSLSKYRVETSV